LTTIVLTLALAGILTLSVEALRPAASAPATSSTTVLGAWVGGDSQAATEQLEASIGRKLAIGHTFVGWGQGLGNLPAWNVASGRTPMLSFGHGVSSRAVAAGRYDAWLASLARGVVALGQPVLLRYGWGMDSTSRSGNERYVAAWRHVHDLFAAQGVRGAWVWAPNADAFGGARGGVDRYWPGDRYVDWIGADGFNSGTCTGGTTWNSFEALFRSFYAWGSARGKPLMVSETGTVEDPADPGHKSAWFTDAASALARSMPNIRAIVYYDQGGRCDWRPETSAQSMDGFVRFARDPVFGTPDALHTTTTTPTPTASTSTVVPTTSTVPPTTTPTTTAAPTTSTVPPSTAAPTTPPQRTDACAAGGGAAIGTTDNAQRIVDAHPAGTIYLVKAGTHQNNFSVRPKSGDAFCGEPGAVLDGGRSLQTAFSGGATNVTLDSITMQNYNSPKQGAAIQPESHASGWLVRNVSSLHSAWAGLLVADGMRILGGHYNDNDQLGIGGNEATGILLDGLDTDPTTIDGPELARNHTLHASCLWEAGGMKWDFGAATIRNAYVHDNDCRGLWADMNAHDALIEHNLVVHNQAEGIFYEISQDAVIRDNQVYDNGYVANGWYWDAGINANASFNVEVYGNRLSGNYNGITGVQQDRPDSTPPQHLLDHYNVHDNLICATGGGGHPTGVVADNGANLAARDITFSRNTIQSAACR
jgi:hypothetical protein